MSDIKSVGEMLSFDDYSHSHIDPNHQFQEGEIVGITRSNGSHTYGEIIEIQLVDVYEGERESLTVGKHVQHEAGTVHNLVTSCLLDSQNKKLTEPPQLGDRVFVKEPRGLTKVKITRFIPQTRRYIIRVGHNTSQGTPIKAVFSQNLRILRPQEQKEVFLPINPGPPLQRVEDAEVLALQDQMQTTVKDQERINLREIQDQVTFPRYKMTIDNANYYCSLPFRHEDHLYVFALVSIEGETYPRLFYLSNSQTVWRTLPFVDMFGQDKIQQLDKGIAEHDTNLPTDLSLNLFELLEPTLPEIADFPITTLIHKIVPTRLDQVEDRYKRFVEPYIDPADEDEYSERYKEEYSYRKERFIGNETIVQSLLSLPRNPEAQPDFSRPQRQIQIQTPLYGKAEAKVFLSKDGNLKYTFVETKDGRVFIANLENTTNNPVTRFGNRQRFDVKNDFLVGLAEYPNQVPFWYEPPEEIRRQDRRHYLRPLFMQQHDFPIHIATERYISAWNYVREFDIIKDYYSSQQRPLPPPERIKVF